MSISDSILFPTGTRQTDRKYYESGARGRFEANLRIVRGTYTTAGAVYSTTFGVGFTGVRNAAGSATITFDPPFSTPPTVTFAAQRADEADANIGAIIGDPTPSSVRLFRKTLGGTPEDGPMHFIAVGPS